MDKRRLYVAINLGVATGLLFNTLVHPGHRIAEHLSAKHKHVISDVATLESGITASRNQAATSHTEEARLPADPFQDRG